jgi:mannose-6-phosphate isomerase-like protein (cupin superfamily)
MKSLAIAVLSVAAVFAAAPAGFEMWKGGKLEAAKKTQQLGNFGNHSLMTSYRDSNGEAEVHEKVADVFIVRSGSATLMIGGKVVAPKTTAPNEIRGTSIEGGEKHTIEAGDIVNIPANTPHQVLVEKGKVVTYDVVKINQK